MNEKELFEFYQRLYFQEIEIRDKISSRLQISLAILIPLIVFFSYLLNSFQFRSFFFIDTFFIFVFLLSIISASLSVRFFILSWFGSKYEFLPTANETESYKDSLRETYKGYPDCESLVEKHLRNYIYGYFKDCSTTNTNTNDKRTLSLHKCNKFIVFSVILSFLSFIIFHFGNLSKVSIQNIRIIEPVLIKENFMNTDTSERDNLDNNSRPAPPPPPPKRVIIEGKEIKEPPSERNSKSEK